MTEMPQARKYDAYRYLLCIIVNLFNLAINSQKSQDLIIGYKHNNIMKDVGY